MSVYKRGGLWWYEFVFGGKRIRESAKTTSKTVARKAEQDRRRVLEHAFRESRDIAAENAALWAKLADLEREYAVQRRSSRNRAGSPHSASPGL